MSQTNQPDPMHILLPRLRSRARRLCRSQEEAEDLAQETVLRLLQALRKGARIEAQQSYAMIVLHNLARQRWRDRHPTEELEDDMISTPPRGPGKIACGEVHCAIDRLPDDQASLMRMVASGETSPARLAHLTNCPVGTVMSRLARARARLRSEMQLKPDAPVSDLL